MSRSFGFLVLAGGLIAVPATAELPRYDIEAYCQQVADYGGNDDAGILKGCVGNEFSAREILEPRWDALPAGTREHCDEVATYGGGSYSILGGCVQMEQDASSTTLRN